MSDSVHSQPPNMREVLGTQFLRVLMNYTFIMFIGTAYDALMPLMYSTSIPVGGLGFSPFQIGQILSAWGLINAIVQCVFTGRLLRMFGARRMFIISIGFMFVAILAFSFESYFARLAGRVDEKVITLLLIQLTCNLMTFVAIGMFTLSSTLFTLLIAVQLQSMFSSFKAQQAGLHSVRLTVLHRWPALVFAASHHIFPLPCSLSPLKPNSPGDSWCTSSSLF